MKRLEQELNNLQKSLQKVLTSSIRAIQGSTEILKSSISTQDSRQADEFVDLIHANALKADTALQAAESYRKLARTEPEPQWIQLDEIVSDVVKRLAPGALPYLALDIPAQCRIKADPGMAKLIITALVSNALRHTGQRTKQLLFFRRVLEMEPHVFVLGDNGCGVPQDTVPTLFGHFVTGELEPQETARVGMGLTVSRLLTEKHGGKIWMESRVNDGTRVFFHFGAMPSP